MRLNRTKHVRNEVIFPKIVFCTSADLRSDPKVHSNIVLGEMLDLHSLVNAGFQSISYQPCHYLTDSVASVFLDYNYTYYTVHIIKTLATPPNINI